MTLEVNLRKKLPHFELDVKLCCPSGCLTAIVGPSGAGKTTLVRLMAGLERPDQGRISLNGTAWVDTGKRIFLKPQKRKLGLVFQDYCLFPHLSVRRNVAFAANDDARVDELLTLFGIRHLQDRKPQNISGGERQRAAFCQALAREPSLLLLDEPFSALDAATRETLRCELRDLKTTLDIPIIHVTHDLGEARFLADAILPVVNGRITPDWLERQYAPCMCGADGDAPLN
ncbi:ATP-binding cassette domain-containing protein [Paucidesulfovibrio longus]|uniref:ATP-binding cassette domain-containing protein n=1 Tax=Paucidesulfovibrio longus TaxID=889 RepID=UPI0003B50E64|nr:ATP-binding cassette domain-containing protein [Paucidesulfovibrio longus]